MLTVECPNCQGTGEVYNHAWDLYHRCGGECPGWFRPTSPEFSTCEDCEGSGLVEQEWLEQVRALYLKKPIDIVPVFA